MGLDFFQFGLGPSESRRATEQCSRLHESSKLPCRTCSGPTWTHLRAQSHITSATWRLLGSTWPSKPHSKCNLALLGSIFGALATLRIELSPTRELDSHVFALLPFKTAFLAQLASSWPQLGAYRGASGPHLAVLGRLLDSTWSLLGASWAQLGASWAAPERL